MPKETIARMKVVERKLGREQALGQAHSDGLVEIDPRQVSKEYLDTMIHEMLHIYFPDTPEWKIAKVATKMARTLWKSKYRRLMD